MKRAVIIGGHSTPALALAEVLQQRGWQIYWFGTKYASLHHKKVISYEFRVLQHQPAVKFVPIKADSWPRRFSWAGLGHLLRLLEGFWQAWLALAWLRPQIVIGFGGYLAPPVILAAWLWRRPIIIHEQTTTVGLANRFGAFFAKKIAIAFAVAGEKLPPAKTVLVGNLLRQEVMWPDKNLIPSPLKKMKSPFIYLTGGKTGSLSLNHFIAQNLTGIIKRYPLIQQTGELEIQRFLKKRHQLSPHQQAQYFPFETVSANEMGWFLARAKLVIARAGANTVSELIWWQKPALLVPLPIAAADEQRRNAHFLANLGLALVVEQRRWEQLSLADFWRLVDQLLWRWQQRDQKKLGKLRRQLAESRDKFANLVEKIAR